MLFILLSPIWLWVICSSKKCFFLFLAVTYLPDKVKVAGKCFRSIRKNELPHILEICVKLENKGITGKCSCVAGESGYCHHIVGLVFYMAHCKMFGLTSLPDDVTCISVSQRCSVPREKRIGTKEIQSVLVKKQRIGANSNKFIKTTLYSSLYFLWNPLQQ